MNKYYVYTHELDGEILFIGTGSGTRYKAKSGRSEEHRLLWDKLDKKIITELSSKESVLLYVENFIINNKLPRLNKQPTYFPVRICDPLYLSKYFYYSEESESGLKWKISWNNSIKIGGDVGCKTDKGYYRVHLGSDSYLVHRIVYSILNNITLDGSVQIDHIDRNKSNNKISNLRLVTAKENARNRNVPSNSKTGVPGVSWCRHYSRWKIAYVEHHKFKVKYIKPRKAYPDLPFETAKELSFIDAVKLKEEIEYALSGC